MKCMLIGTGFGAQHALWLSQFQGIELCGLAYFSDRDQALAVQSRYGIVELSDDAGSMILSGRYDLIVITSPPSTHLHLMRVAAKASVAVVLEKPVAESVEVAEEIGMIARATGKPAYIFSNGAYIPQFKSCESLLSQENSEWSRILTRTSATTFSVEITHFGLGDIPQAALGLEHLQIWESTYLISCVS